MNKLIDRQLLIKIYNENNGRNWEKITNEYNVIAKDNKKANSLRAYKSKHKEHFGDVIEQEELHNSNRYKELSTEEYVSENELLEFHGYDPLFWEVGSSNSTRSKIGTKKGVGYFINTYNKITVKKREIKFNDDILKETIKEIFKDREPYTVEKYDSCSNGYLLIPFKDMHFGINTYKDYIKHQAETLKYIESNKWKEITFIIGSDLFNTNDSHGRTFNDTSVDKMKTDLVTRMNHAKMFYEPLIQSSIENSAKVTVVYEMGNHDKDTSAQFVNALSWLFVDVEFIIKEQHYQTINFNEGKIVIGTHHGDKKNKPKAVAEAFHRYYSKEFALADYSEILVGHLHHRFSAEYLNLFVQGLSTASNDSDFDYMIGKGQGYKAFMIRIYNDHGLKGIQMIDGTSIK